MNILTRPLDLSWIFINHCTMVNERCEIWLPTQQTWQLPVKGRKPFAAKSFTPTKQLQAIEQESKRLLCT
ncbi:hypothetical protein T265_04739 [Opisthorchis viverrini]|uniref:Uncharacterized protein n=1 Tax=Opisthorchis viverrini TaxID=6198 RepID=A0A074ZYM1_OPIVI|nr:hypothetical protein T265_04739 [Opisthorchis viverrini]KER28430.1 hypothetical protein T265_04739 [Opisthorchis viverrini]